MLLIPSPNERTLPYRWLGSSCQHFLFLPSCYAQAHTKDMGFFHYYIICLELTFACFMFLLVQLLLLDMGSMI